MPRILVVEDEAHIQRILSLWLQRHGYDILEAADGAAALEVLDRETVDLIISDMNMPGTNGFQLVQAARNERHLDVPIMLLTARCDQDQLAEKMEPYGVRLYPKPFVPSRLVADIDRLLGVVES